MADSKKGTNPVTARDQKEIRDCLTTVPMKRMFKNEGGKKENITVEVKKEIIRKHEQGVKVADIARFYKKSTSTICTILKKKEEIRGLDVAKGVTRLSKQRPPILENVEKLLLVWMNEKQLAGDTVTENLICEKAKALYSNLRRKLPGTSTENEEGFNASRGWFHNFKRRSGIQSVASHGEAASSNAKEAEAFVAEFQKLVGFLPQQVFHCPESGPLGKKVPKRTYITAEENASCDHKPVEDGLTLEQQEDVSSEKEENKPETSLSSNDITGVCRMWETVKSFVEKHHPNKAVAVRAADLFDDEAMAYFREMLKKRQKRELLEKKRKKRKINN